MVPSRMGGGRNSPNRDMIAGVFNEMPSLQQKRENLVEEFRTNIGEKQIRIVINVGDPNSNGPINQQSQSNPREDQQQQKKPSSFRIKTPMQSNSYQALQVKNVNILDTVSSS